MNGVKSLQQFRAVINTCRFWGDTWAITTLERALNTKFILLSEENFEEGDLDNVLQCGQLNDDELESSGTLHPITILQWTIMMALQVNNIQRTWYIYL